MDADLRGIPAAAWKRLAGARHRLIALDYDGTLAPLCPERDRARPAAGAVEALRGLVSSTCTTVAILSGRPVEDVTALLGACPGGIPGLLVLGEHGWERGIGPGLHAHPLPRQVEAALDRAEHAIADAGWLHAVERKRTALVLHTRSMPPDQARRAEHAGRELWGRIQLEAPVRLDAIDGGLELRAAGRDKGTALRELAAGSPPGTIAMYIGDDETDEDVFRELRRSGNGIGLRVGQDRVATSAQGTLATCSDVVRCLERLCEAGGRPELMTPLSEAPR